MEIPYVDQVSLGVERQIGTNWSAGVNYVRNWGAQLLVSDNTNLGPPTVLTAANAASLGVSNPSAAADRAARTTASNNRLDPLYNNIQVVSSSGWSSYYGVQFMRAEAPGQRLLAARELHPLGVEGRRVGLHAGRAAQRPVQPARPSARTRPSTSVTASR